MSEIKLVLRPLVGLLQGRNIAEVEHFTVEEIEKYRQLRDGASQLEERVAALEQPAAGHELERAYVSAMIAVHAQQTVVSTLIDILGYVPEVPTRMTN